MHDSEFIYLFDTEYILQLSTFNSKQIILDLELFLKLALRII